MDAGIERLVALRIADVMAKNVVTVSVEETVSQVAQIFGKHKITAAPVIDQDGTCVGMISACDFMFRTGSIGNTGRFPDAGQPVLDSIEPNASGSQECESEEGQTVRTWMSRSVQTMGGSSALVAAARMMCTGHLHHLPVIDESGRPIGILSTLDVVAAMVNSIDEAKGDIRI